MQFTLGTLTSLFTLALMGASIALMFSTYENTVLDDKFPFDIQMFSGDLEDGFEDEKAIIDALGLEPQYYSYHIYTDQEIQTNTWILTHLSAWGAMYRNGDGTPNMPKIEKMLSRENIYYPCDTYMSISDFNYLRTMLGYDEIPLAPGEYLVQIKPRLYKEAQEIGKDLQIADASGQNLLTCAGVVADPFSQDGHNGADYILVVPDAVLERMTPYYTELVAHVDGEIPMELQDSLDALEEEDRELPFSYMLYYMEKEETEMQLCTGSDNIISYVGTYLVRDSLISRLKYILGSMIIPLFYIGLVFVCVAMTVLSVQQLSDSAKYKFRYDVLAKLGLDRRQICGLILKQLAAYYLCPALLAVVISGKMILFVSSRFVDLTGVPAAAGRFFLESISLFFGIYLVYFIVTYVGFQRNVEEKTK